MRLNFPRSLSAIAVFSLSAFAQTQVDLRTQSKSVDFSGAAATKPARMGASLPATCGQGEFFFLTSATPGQNLYGCSAANTWSLEGAAVAQASLIPTELNKAGQILSTDGTNPLWQPVAGDLSGSPSAFRVTGLRGVPVATAVPVDGQLLKYDAASASWLPTALGGDVTGPPATAQVAGLRGRSLSTAAPSNGQALKFNSTTSIWEPASLAGDVSGTLIASQVTALRGFGLSGATPADGQLLRFNGSTHLWEPISLGGDVTGNPATATVSALRGRALSSSTPSDGQLLEYSASLAQWQPLALGGDVTGNPASLTVAKLQGNGVSAVAPGNAQLLAWSSTSNSWTPTTLQTPRNYAGAFTYANTFSIPGTQHNLNTANLLVSCYDNATPANLVEPSHVTIDPVSFNVTVTFANPQSGTCVVNGSGGLGLGATAVSGSAVLSFPAIATGACSGDLSLAVTGAAVGNGIAPSWPALPAGLIGMMWPSGPGVVSVRVCNFSGAAAILPPLTYGATLVRGF